MPLSLQGRPALIEHLLPAQKLSIESYKEQMANIGKTLTALGGYWKGRKPLVLNRACVLASLLPATDQPRRDLEIFEMLMSMDDVSLSKRLGLTSPEDIVRRLALPDVWRYFVAVPADRQATLPDASPFDVDDYEFKDAQGQTKSPRLRWREDVLDDDRHALAAQLLVDRPYRDLASAAQRAEEMPESVLSHVWAEVNAHLGTQASSLPELVSQLGVMRWGRRPRVADTFAGSGQIPFEAARLGCDVYASDLNPVACMLTWGALNLVGGGPEVRAQLGLDQKALVATVTKALDDLGVESDGQGWRTKVLLYCAEVKCPETGWTVPLLPTLVVSKSGVVADLVPDPVHKRFEIVIRSGATPAQMAAAVGGTVQTEAKGQDPHLVHNAAGHPVRFKISSLRGDHRRPDGSTGNRLRLWEKADIEPRPGDVFQERLYCVMWVRTKPGGRKEEYEFRSVTPEDLARERQVASYVQEHLVEWQTAGWIPDMRIEAGDKTDEPIRTQGWTHWHHLFNPRQLLLAGLVNRHSGTALKLGLCQMLNSNARLTRWSVGDGDGRSGGVKQVFDNQALSTLFNYGCRGSPYALDLLTAKYKSFPLPATSHRVAAVQASAITGMHDLFITDPPYGDAVKYEEILEYFIAWMRQSPPAEFSDWVWDSRRALAIKGEDHDFKMAMVDAYKAMAQHMADDGLQIIMFTHQDNAIWADMANIVWASGLRVTAAWYVVTETDSALRDGQHVKGTILLVLRKRTELLEGFRDELAYELEDEVKRQVGLLTGLNEASKDLYHGENLFEDADLQMAGYAAALRVLTRYAVIDGVAMSNESLRPRVKGRLSLVDELIEFAVGKANEFLVPRGLDPDTWSKLNGPERFYLKIVDARSSGPVSKASCDNYAKAFKVREYGDLFERIKANSVTPKSADGFGKRSMATGDAFGSGLLRATLYGIHLLGDGKTSSDDVLGQLRQLIPSYYDRRSQVQAVAHFLYQKTMKTLPEESTRAMVLRDLVHNERA